MDVLQSFTIIFCDPIVLMAAAAFNSSRIDELPSTYLKRLYYDTVNFNPHMLSMARDIFGPDHMVMGSDYPHLLGSIEKSVSSIEGMDFSPAEKEQVFSGTALSLLADATKVPLDRELSRANSGPQMPHPRHDT